MFAKLATVSHVQNAAIGNPVAVKTKGPPSGGPLRLTVGISSWGYFVTVIEVPKSFLLES